MTAIAPGRTAPIVDGGAAPWPTGEEGVQCKRVLAALAQGRGVDAPAWPNREDARRG